MAPHFTWQKKGLIYCPQGDLGWNQHSALQPTPILLDDKTLRVYVGMRDANGVGRVGFVDLNPENPSEVLHECVSPALDIGMDGAFDENGVIPCAITRRDGKLYLYYAGYALGHKIRFTVFGGMAVSTDNGLTFQRWAPVPVVDRTPTEVLFRVIHSILPDNGIWRTWYGGGGEYWNGSKKTLPSYNIRYMESPDGQQFPDHGQVAVDIMGDEYRVGRPYVYKDAAGYHMFFGAGSETVPYELCYASSSDGITWTRHANALSFVGDSDGWDATMMAYPAVVTFGARTYLFYNGNDYGKHGFGYAELIRQT